MGVFKWAVNQHPGLAGAEIGKSSAYFREI